MKQREMVLAVVVVGVVAAALWVWRENSLQPEVAMAPSKAALQDAFHNPSAAPTAPTEPAPAASPSPATAAAAPEVEQTAVKTEVEPQSVDTPEPAARKFARGGRSDESEQSQN